MPLPSVARSVGLGSTGRLLAMSRAFVIRLTVAEREDQSCRSVWGLQRGRYQGLGPTERVRVSKTPGMFRVAVQMGLLTSDALVRAPRRETEPVVSVFSPSASVAPPALAGQGYHRQTTQ